MDQSKSVIVVLGAGRSGTSLLMQVLAGMGLSVSEHLVSARYHNPEGPMEDVEIANIYDKEILPSVGSSRVLPFPYDVFSQSASYSVCLAKLGSIVAKNVNTNRNLIWGFKDPFTSSVLPIWFKVFNQCGVVPKFILCVRNPAAVVVSREKSFGDNEAIGELAWLNSTVSALYDSKCDVFIIHYEDWFSDAVNLSTELLEYTGLDINFDGDLNKILLSTVKNNLNRSGSEDYAIRNVYVRKLYHTLKGCRGHDFPRDSLMAVVKECHDAMEGFKGWFLMAQKKERALVSANEELALAKKEMLLKEDMMKRIAKLEMELNQKNEITENLINLQKQIDQFIKIV